MAFPDDFYKNYSDNDYFFSTELLTRYCLSLFTKPFVILTGISGTGKTKIAQLLTTPEPSLPPTPSVTSDDDDNYLILRITRGIMDGADRGNFQYKHLKAIFDEDELVEINEKIESLKEAGRDDNICEPYPIKILYGEEGSLEEISASVYLQRASSPLVRARFRSKRSEEPSFDSRAILQKLFKEGDVLKLEPVDKRRYRIISVNDAEVKAENDRIEEIETKMVKNTCFISVKSNWTESSDIFGYYNPIEQIYYLSPLTKFLLTALEHPNKPFFLILDEMNLSKVEHYFSDFLSCLESRHEHNGALVQEAIQLHSAGAFVDSNDPYFDVVPHEIDLPLNLYVTGTVNIDETTNMFSPKVLDRAHVIEFNDVDIDGYLETAPAIGDNFKLDIFPKFGEFSLAERKHFLALDENSRNTFKGLNDILKLYNLHFGYRVLNEVALFIGNVTKYIGTSEEIRLRAVDIMIVQKILTKLNGTMSSLEAPLVEIMKYLLDRDAEISFENVSEIVPSDSSYPLSIRKLKAMYINLYKNGFSSFIE